MKSFLASLNEAIDEEKTRRRSGSSARSRHSRSPSPGGGSSRKGRSSPSPSRTSSSTSSKTKGSTPEGPKIRITCSDPAPTTTTNSGSDSDSDSSNGGHHHHHHHHRHHHHHHHSHSKSKSKSPGATPPESAQDSPRESNSVPRKQRAASLSRKPGTTPTPPSVAIQSQQQQPACTVNTLTARKALSGTIVIGTPKIATSLEDSNGTTTSHIRSSSQEQQQPSQLQYSQSHPQLPSQPQSQSQQSLIATAPPAAGMGYWSSTQTRRTCGKIVEGLSFLCWPIDDGFVRGLCSGLRRACERNDKFLGDRDLRYLLNRAAETFSKEPNTLNIRVPRGTRFYVVGDVHGQFFDLLRLTELIAADNADGNGPGSVVIFLGDYVDRGSWGVECMILLLAMKLRAASSGGSGGGVTFPQVVMLRGNHEGAACNRQYGFASEVRKKYSDGVFALFQKVFAAMPVAALIRPSATKSPSLGATLSPSPSSLSPSPSSSSEAVTSTSPKRNTPTPPQTPPPHLSLHPSESPSKQKGESQQQQQQQQPGVFAIHGGLWRNLAAITSGTFTAKGEGEGSKGFSLDLAMAELKSLNRFACTDTFSGILGDALWGDPSVDPGFKAHSYRNMGVEFGPDVTRSFMESLNLRVMFRAHEGPDARQKRLTMPQINRGYSIDFTWGENDKEGDSNNSNEQISINLNSNIKDNELKINLVSNDSNDGEGQTVAVIQDSNDDCDQKGVRKESRDNDPMLITMFSAPNYPQFKSSSSAARGDTLGAFAKVLFTNDDETKVNVSFVSYSSAPHPTGVKYAPLKD